MHPIERLLCAFRGSYEVDHYARTLLCKQFRYLLPYTRAGPGYYGYAPVKTPHVYVSVEPPQHPCTLFPLVQRALPPGRMRPMRQLACGLVNFLIPHS